MEHPNPIQPPLDDLFARLNILNGLLFHHENHLNNFRKLFKQSLGSGNMDISKIWAGASLVIRDLTEWPEDGWAKYYPSGNFSSQGKQYLEIVDVLIHRESAWTISQAYEAFETFLKNITAVFLREHSQYADTEKLKKSDYRLKKLSLKPTGIEYWETFVRLSYRNNICLLKFLQKIVPELKKAEKQNNRAIDLTEWYEVATQIRHAATHSNMLIKSNKMSSWSPSTHKVLACFSSGNYTNNGYALAANRKDAETNLILFAEYAFAIFKCLSELKNYNWKYSLENNKSCQVLK